jgi:predicted adenine nucleotide alpha hydrolase (AANH) superfamily ATPase
VKKTLLLHTCCAPCMSYVFELVRQEYEVLSFFYNPNISPRSEYDRRLGELRRFSESAPFQLLEGAYDARDWTAAVKPYRFLGEKSERCEVCIRYRLRESFIRARETGIGAVATVLSVSPHKDAAAINRAGRELSQEFSIAFIEADYKKKDGFKKTVELSRQYGFYRQDYCGCVYSANPEYRPRRPD